jgi:hypothetical protein
MLLCIYLFYINYHRIKHIYSLIKSDDLDVRNSPLDRLASILSKGIYCSKGICDVAGPVAIIFGGCNG